MASAVPIVRAAFDFGSGMTKLCVAVCRDRRTPLQGLRVLYEEEAEVLLGHSVNASPDGAIDPDVLRKLYATTDRLVAIVRRTVAEERKKLPDVGVEITGICTAVYREASNGADALKELQRRVGVASIRVLPQADEGTVGFLTGVAASAPVLRQSPRGRVVVWDSGGSSFQMTLGTTTSKSSQSSSFDPQVVPDACVQGNWGSSKALRALLREVQNAPSGTSSPNPVPVADAKRLQAHFRAAFEHDEIFKAHAAWLASSRKDAEWVGIGGPSCAFNMSWRATTGADRKARVVMRENLREAIDRDLCGRSDRFLADAGYVQTEMVVAKCCLVLAVLDTLDLPFFRYYETTGSTLGMIAHGPLWAATTKSGL